MSIRKKAIDTKFSRQYLVCQMTMRTPSLAARALATLVEDWPTYTHGECMSKILSIAGFKVINHGNFSSVIEGKPGEVIKLFSLQDTGYQHLLDYSIQSKCEHMFRVFSITKSGKYGIVELEHLKHSDRKAISISNYIDRCKHDPKSIRHPWGDNFRDIILDLNQSIKKHNIDHGSDLHWDNHEHNILFRGKTPVLADVIFGEV